MDLITRLLHALASRLRVLLYRARGVRVLGHVSLRAIEVPRHCHGITLENGVALDRGVTLLLTSPRARLTIGPRVYINRRVMLDVDELLEIGADVMIGPGCYVTDHDHTVMFNRPPAEGALVSAPTRIGARCWLGANVTVLKGVTIGEGTVIGAGAVVTKSLPANIVAVGNPARVLREIAPATSGGHAD